MLPSDRLSFAEYLRQIHPSIAPCACTDPSIFADERARTGVVALFKLYLPTMGLRFRDETECRIICSESPTSNEAVTWRRCWNVHSEWSEESHEGQFFTHRPSIR
jgi:hypothetical protein